MKQQQVHLHRPVEPIETDADSPREGYVPEESPGFDDDIELPLDVEDDWVIPDEERVIDVPS